MPHDCKFEDAQEFSSSNLGGNYRTQLIQFIGHSIEITWIIRHKKKTKHFFQKLRFKEKMLTVMHRLKLN